MLGLPKYVLYHNKIIAESYGLAAPKQLKGQYQYLVESYLCLASHCNQKITQI